MPMAGKDFLSSIRHNAGLYPVSQGRGVTTQLRLSQLYGRLTERQSVCLVCLVQDLRLFAPSKSVQGSAVLNIHATARLNERERWCYTPWAH